MATSHSSARALRRAGVLALALLPGLAFMLAFVIRSARIETGWRFTLFDDALISMAYGRTLASTGEWVWFPGAERVQGITNPLWSGVMALVHLPNQGDTTAIVLMTGISAAIVLATAVVVFQIVVAAGAPERVGLVAAGLTPFLYPLVFWSLRGMEVGLVALMSVLLSLAVLRIHSPGTHSRRWVVIGSLAAAAAVLTRLDAIAVVMAVLLVGVWMMREKSKGLLFIAGVTVVAAVGMLAFQGLYWGDVLPNTYRLKVEGISYLERVERGLLATAKAAPLVVIAALSWQFTRRPHVEFPPRLLAGMAGAVCAVSVGYSVWTGGDAWEWTLILNRTLSVSLPLLLAAWLVAATSRQSLPAARLVVLAISGVGLGLTTNPGGFDVRLGLIGLGLTGLAATLAWITTAPRVQKIPRTLGLALAFAIATSSPGALLWITNGGANVADDQRFAARSEELSAVTSPDATIAVMWAGAPGYYSDRAMIDMFGKSDRVIATTEPRIDPATGKPFEFIPGHNKWDYEYSIKELRPDVVFQLGDDRETVEGDILSWGYVRGCLSDGWISYFREDSTLINWESVKVC